MDIVFLDANVLFSAAYREGAGVARLWDLTDVDLVTSTYAAEEARRNLTERRQRARFDELIGRTRVEAVAISYDVPDSVELPEKDRPILAAAVSLRATHLLTGDIRHFGALLGRDVAGLTVLPPARYLNERGRR